MYVANSTRAWGVNVDTHFRDTFFTSPIWPSSNFLWAQFMYYIIFYSFKHDPNPCNILEKLRKCGLESESVSFETFASAQHACYQVGIGYWQHHKLMEEVLYPKFPPQKSFQPMNLSHIISQIMHEASRLFYPIKSKSDHNLFD